MKQWIRNNGMVCWYTILFSLLGLIDQRRGSAVGEIQMIFANCTGIVIALMVLPSVKFDKFRQRIYKIWTPICVTLTVVACALGARAWDYMGQWIVAVLNVAVWSYLIIYIVREWKEKKEAGWRKLPFFCCFVVLMLFMQFSRHEGIVPLWYLLIFGGMYLIGIAPKNRSSFFDGLLNGFILWFFVQQIIAFGFRPYDYVRYRGLYSGETQNGMFYLLAYCAFLLRWVLLKRKGGKRLLQAIWFLLSAGCISFMLFTGGKAPLVGVALVTLLIYIWNDIVCSKSLYRWMLHCCALGVCVVISFPLVYGCIRYLPTILHHPIWFEGEYVAESSVHSFDPWDSDRYVSFETAFEINIGRILQGLGINYEELFAAIPGGLRVEAAEYGDLGSTPDTPFALPGTDYNNSVSVRESIYAYYAGHLNLLGHSKEQPGFYFGTYTYIHHAHNMFLQVAYDYGIPAGILFLVLCIYGVCTSIRQRNEEGVIGLTFWLAILSFGMFEMAVVPGQITMTLLWILVGCFEHPCHNSVKKVGTNK